MWRHIKEAQGSHQDESESFVGMWRGIEGQVTQHDQCLEKTSG